MYDFGQLPCLRAHIGNSLCISTNVEESIILKVYSKATLLHFDQIAVVTNKVPIPTISVIALKKNTKIALSFI